VEQKAETIVMYSDGGSRGNPGPAALGVYIETFDKGYGEFLGIKTNNEAEYAGIVFGLKKIKALLGKARAKKAHVECRMDSELACKQLNHIYKIENEKLQPLFLEVWNLMLDFAVVQFVHVPREQNTKADAEANRAMDEAAGQRSQTTLL
jgi:ribonuclease HI